MTEFRPDLEWAPGSIEVSCQSLADAQQAEHYLRSRWLGHEVQAQLGFEHSGPDADGLCSLSCRVSVQLAQQWAPGHDTLSLAQRLSDPGESAEALLDREILLAMLMGPMAIAHPDLAELQSALAIRRNIARYAATARMSFETSRAERPSDFWRKDEEWGFLLRPGASLIEALRRATQPGDGAAPFSFSCYRATEYVLLLSLAEELVSCNPALYESLQAMWQQRSISSGRFHDVFLMEVGSQAEPLPMRWYIPGDRVWFRNPDEASADASGYEGSWVFYLGGGRFCNFWQCNRPFDLASKCLEVYHWRHATFHDAEGELRIDEARVAQQVAQSLRQPSEVDHILERMTRYRDPRGVYAEGGCIDSTREWVRWVGPRHCAVTLPSP